MLKAAFLSFFLLQPIGMETVKFLPARCPIAITTKDPEVVKVLIKWANFEITNDNMAELVNEISKNKLGDQYLAACLKRSRLI